MNSQELRALQEAYSQVYELDEVKGIEGHINPNTGKSFYGLDSGLAMTPKKRMETRANSLQKRGEGKRANKIRAVMNRPSMEEAVDLFDTILEYLVAEGYADTNESALVIMANMSEDWRESIVEGVFDFLPKPTTAIPGKYGKNSVLSKKDGVEGVSDKSKPGSFTPQKGGFDRMDAERYGAEQIKKGSNVGDINLAGRRETPGRVK